MSLITTIINTVSQGLQGINSPYAYFNWFRSNFNMPVPSIFAGGTYNRYTGYSTTVNAGTSYDLSGFSAGMEIAVGLTCWDFENNGASVENISTQLYNFWANGAGSPLFYGYNGNSYSYSLPASSWVELIYAINIGCAGWEVTSSGTHYYRGSCVGTPTATTSTTVTMSNVPSTAGVSYNTGSIWVEGAYLCYINANTWKHTIVGTSLFTYAGTSKAGSFWLDSTTNLLCWVGADGYVYRSQWAKQQFASTFSNGATGSVYAGTSKTGTIWADNEYGLTHLAYIGTDGYKYITGAGNNPY